MPQEIYTKENSEYLQNNPTWHSEHSWWKAEKILKIINRNNLHFKSVVEVGCGAGEILNQIQQKLPDKSIQFDGYEISPDAYAMSRQRAKNGLRFFNEDFLLKDVHYDLLLMIDVFEHVEDYIGFIRKCSEKATYKIYHIPLDLCSITVRKNQLIGLRKSIGHLHHFMKETALATIEDTGQEVIDFFYTNGMIEVYNQGLKNKFWNTVRKVISVYNKDFAVKLLGGYSLMVLAK
jgi:SAM-dependent methyltransferase